MKRWGVVIGLLAGLGLVGCSGGGEGGDDSYLAPEIETVQSPSDSVQREMVVDFSRLSLTGGEAHLLDADGQTIGVVVPDDSSKAVFILDSDAVPARLNIKGGVLETNLGSIENEAGLSIAITDVDGSEVIYLSPVAFIAEQFCGVDSNSEPCLEQLAIDADDSGQVNIADLVSSKAGFVQTENIEVKVFQYLYLALKSTTEEALLRSLAMDLLNPSIVLLNGSRLQAPAVPEIVINNVPEGFETTYFLDGEPYFNEEISKPGRYLITAKLSRDGKEYGDVRADLIVYETTIIDRKEITSDGGTLYVYKSEDDGNLAGSKIVIPEGAITENKEIIISSVNSSNLTKIPGQIGETIVLEPSGLHFEKPVSIRLPYGNEVGERFLLQRTTEGGEVDYLSPSKIEDGFVYFETDHFSTYSLISEIKKSASKKFVEDINFYASDVIDRENSAFKDYSDAEWQELLSVKVNPWDDESITIYNLVQERLTNLIVLNEIKNNGNAPYVSASRGYVGAYQALYPKSDPVKLSGNFKVWTMFSEISNDPKKLSFYVFDEALNKPVLRKMYDYYTAAKGARDTVEDVEEFFESGMSEFPFSSSDLTKSFYQTNLNTLLKLGEMGVSSYTETEINVQIQNFFALGNINDSRYYKWDEADEVAEQLISSLDPSYPVVHVDALGYDAENGAFPSGSFSLKDDERKQFWINVLGLYHTYYTALIHEENANFYTDDISYVDEIYNILISGVDQLNKDTLKNMEEVGTFVNGQDVSESGYAEICTDEGINLVSDYKTNNFTLLRDDVTDLDVTYIKAGLYSGGDDVRTNFRTEVSGCTYNGLEEANSREMTCHVELSAPLFSSVEVKRNFLLEYDMHHKYGWVGDINVNSSINLSVSPRKEYQASLSTGDPVRVRYDYYSNDYIISSDGSAWRIPYTIDYLDDGRISDLDAEPVISGVEHDNSYIYFPVDTTASSFDISINHNNVHRCHAIVGQDFTVDVPTQQQISKVRKFTLPDGTEPNLVSGVIGDEVTLHFDFSGLAWSENEVRYDLNGDGIQERTAEFHLTADGSLQVLHLFESGQYKPSVYVNGKRYEYQGYFEGVPDSTPRVELVTPRNAYVDEMTEFTVLGHNLPSSTILTMDSLDCGETEKLADDNYRLICSSASEGQYLLKVIDGSTGSTISFRQITFVDKLIDQPGTCQSNATSLGLALFGVPESAIPPVSCGYLAESCGGKSYNEFLPGVDAHAGLDYAGTLDQQVYSPIDAKVSVVDTSKGRVGLRELMPDGSLSPDTFFFEHLNTIDDGIYPTATINKGSLIGGVGEKGNASGVHLHIEYRKNYSSDYLVGNTSCGSNNCDAASVSALTRNPTYILGCSSEEPDDTDSDNDSDGYSNPEEESAGSDPDDPDSTPEDLDGDGFSNSAEESAGSDPNNASSTPDDLDGDGVSNEDDDFPEDPEKTTYDRSLTFSSETLPDGTLLNLDTSYTKTWTISYQGDLASLEVNAVPDQTSGLTYGPISPVSQSLQRNSSLTFSVPIEVPEDIPAGDYYASWKLVDQNESQLYWSNGNPAIISYDFTVPEPEQLQGGIHLSSSLVGVDQEVEVMLTLNTGEKPFLVSYSFGDGSATTPMTVSADTHSITTTYSEAGDYLITANVRDAANQTMMLQTSITVEDSDSTIAEWQASGFDVDTGESESDLVITQTTIGSGSAQSPDYLVDWEPSIPSTNYFTRLTLPVVGVDIDLSKRTRITTITKAEDMDASYDRYIGITTSTGVTYHSSMLADTDGFIREINFNNGGNDYYYTGDLTDERLGIASQARAYAVEIDGTNLKSYRYVNGSYELLHSHASSGLTGAGLKQLEFGFKGTGHLQLVLFEYDKNGDGSFSSDEKHMLLTESQQFDWVDFAAVQPSEDLVSAYDVLVSGFDTFDFNDFQDESGDSLETVWRYPVRPEGGLIQWGVNYAYTSDGWVRDHSSDTYEVVLKPNGWVATADECEVSEDGLAVILTCDTGQQRWFAKAVDLEGQSVANWLELLITDQYGESSTDAQNMIDAIAGINTAFGPGSTGYQFSGQRLQTSVQIDCGAVNVSDTKSDWICDAEDSYNGSIVASSYSEVIGQEWYIDVAAGDDIYARLAGDQSDASGLLVEFQTDEVVGEWHWQVMHGEQFIVMEPYDAGSRKKILTIINGHIVKGDLREAEDGLSGFDDLINKVNTSAIESITDLLQQSSLPVLNNGDGSGGDDLYRLYPSLHPQIDFSTGTIKGFDFSPSYYWGSYSVTVSFNDQELCRASSSERMPDYCDIDGSVALEAGTYVMTICSDNDCIETSTELSTSPLSIADPMFEQCLRRMLDWDGELPEAALKMVHGISCDISELQNVPEAPDMRINWFELTNNNDEKSWTIPAFSLHRDSIYLYGFNLQELSAELLPELKEIACGEMEIESLDLTKNKELIYLSAYDNKLTDIDISNNVNLQEVDLGGNYIESIDLYENVELRNLYIPENKLQSIDVSKLLLLEKLSVGDNSLTSLDVSNLTKLWKVSAWNNRLTNLDLSSNEDIKELWLSDNELSNLDVSKSILLEEINVDNNNLMSVDLSGKNYLRFASLSNNHINYIDVSDSPLIQYFYIDNNDLSVLDVSGKEKLHGLSAHHNQIEFVDISGNYALGWLNLEFNNISSIAIPESPDLRYISLGDNNLLSLDLSLATSLQSISAHNNSLNSIVFPDESSLVRIFLDDNNLTSLTIHDAPDLDFISAGSNDINHVNFSGLVNLKELWLQANFLNTIDVSAMPRLEILKLWSNNISTLDVSNNQFLYDLSVDENVEVID